MSKMDVPKFGSIEEEEQFWQTTDTADFMDDLEFVPAGVGTLSDDLCPTCKGHRRLRRRNLTLADKRLTLHRAKVYYCPRCDEASPTREVAGVIPRLIAVVAEADLS
jgi:hypothetical protein